MPRGIIINNSSLYPEVRREEMSVKSNNRRDMPRYPLIVDIELTDLQSGIKIRARTKNLSLFGCGIDTLNPFPKGAKLRIVLSHRDDYLVADARVVYGSPISGMGVVFIGVEPEDERILDGWLAELGTINRPT
jgi:hypothetical protein